MPTKGPSSIADIARKRLTLARKRLQQARAHERKVRGKHAGTNKVSLSEKASRVVDVAGQAAGAVADSKIHAAGGKVKPGGGLQHRGPTDAMKKRQAAEKAFLADQRKKKAAKK